MPAVNVPRTRGPWIPPSFQPTIARTLPRITSPTAIAGLQGWWDFSALGLADGTAISTISDGSTNGRTATQATGAKQPIFKTAIQNGLGVGRFDSTASQNLSTASFALGQPITCVAVIVGNATTNAGRFAGSADAALRFGWNEFVPGHDHYGGTSFGPTSPVSDTTWKIVTVIANGATSVARSNQTQDGTGNIGAGSIATGFTLGAADNAGDQPWPGDIGELVIYDSVLSGTDLAAIETYLYLKWFVAAPATAYTQAVSGILSFTGTQAKQTSRALAAVASFTGALVRSTAHNMTAVLSFVGTTAKATARALTATLSFTGATTKRTARALTAVLSFTGAQSRATSKGLTATLSFVGSAPHAMTRALTASLTFTGTTTKRTARALAAVLSFIGNLASGKQFARAMTATLSFTGAQVRQTGKALPAVLSFTGTTSRAITRTLTAGASFTGTTAKATRRALTATLTSTGALAAGRQFARALTATVGFSGSVTKRTTRAFTGALTSSAGFVTTFTSGAVAAAKTLLLTVADLARTTVNAMSIGRTTAMSSTEALMQAQLASHDLTVGATDISRVTVTISDGPAQ